MKTIALLMAVAFLGACSDDHDHDGHDHTDGHEHTDDGKPATKEAPKTDETPDTGAMAKTRTVELDISGMT